MRLRAFVLPVATLAAALALPLAGAGAEGRQAAPQASPPPSAQAESPYIPTFRIVGVARPRVSIAVPAFSGSDSDPKAQENARALQEIVRGDLDYSGYFDIVKEEYYRLVSEQPSDLRVKNYKEWLGIGAEALLLGRVGADPSNVVLEGGLFDTTNQRMALGKRYRGEPDLLRVLAHKLSDEVVRHYTGQAGVALTKIAFVSQVGKAKEIFMMDYDGARSKRLTSTGSINLSPAWSPDGGEIAFASYRGGSPELVILNKTGELRRAFEGQGDLNSAPAWSADGRSLAFSSTLDGNAEIYILRSGDKTPRRITQNPAIDTSPAWSANGREIAFTSDRSGAPQIYVMDAEGTNVRRLTYDLSYCDAASWSPQGDRIAFTCRSPGGFDIYVKDLANLRLARLTEGTNINEWPRWSPDGEHLAFASNRTGGFDIYTMFKDGSRVRRLTRGGNNYSPAWSR